MEWRGIEWIVPIYNLLILLMPIFGFIAFWRRIKQKALTKARGFLYYSLLVISPVVTYTVLFFGLVGLEEMTHTALLSEGLARSFLIMIGFGLIVCLVSLAIFGIALALISNQALSPNQANPRADVKNRRG